MANICRTAPELWTSMLWSRRAMTADPKVRSVYDLSYAANAVLTRVSGPTSSCLKQHQTPILVGSDAFQYAPYAYASAVDSTGNDLQLVSSDISKIEWRTAH